jgi:hypothetical protein
MSDLKALLERADRAVADVPLPDGGLEGLERRRDRKHRNQRIRAGALGVVVFALAAVGFVRLLGSERTPATEPRGPFDGTWVSMREPNGDSRTMTVRTAADGAIAVEVHDDEAGSCSGGPSTMIGTGRIEGGTSLVVHTPHYTCDNGSEPNPKRADSGNWDWLPEKFPWGLVKTGWPMDNFLLDYTFALDAETQLLADDHTGGVWVRRGAPAPRPEELPATSYEFLDGDVTFGAGGWEQGENWAWYFDGNLDERIFVLGIPRQVITAGPYCRPLARDPLAGRSPSMPGPTNAEALAESIRADADLQATEPAALTVGGAPALQMDITAAPGASLCSPDEDGPEGTGVVREGYGWGGENAAITVTGDERMRLYLVDVPDGSGRILAIAIVGPDAGFERVLEGAAPFVDSFEFRIS